MNIPAFEAFFKFRPCGYRFPQAEMACPGKRESVFSLKRKGSIGDGTRKNSRGQAPSCLFGTFANDIVPPFQKGRRSRFRLHPDGRPPWTLKVFRRTGSEKQAFGESITQKKQLLQSFDHRCGKKAVPNRDIKRRPEKAPLTSFNK